MSQSPVSPLRSDQTYHALQQHDTHDSHDNTSEPSTSSPRPRPLSSYSQASTIVNDKRLSTASLQRRVRKRKKTLAGDRFFRSLARLPLIWKAALVVLLTGLPFGIFAIIAHTALAGKYVGAENLRVTYNELSIFLMIAWISFLMVIVVAEFAGRFFSWLCRQSVKTSNYAPLADTMWFRLTLIAWIGILHESTCQIWPISMEKGHLSNWVWKLRVVFEFLLVIFAVILVQGMLLQLIAVKYIGGYIGPRSEQAVDELETLQRLDDLLKPQEIHSKSTACMKLFRKIFLRPRKDIFDDIRHGKLGEEETAAYAAIIWSTVAGIKQEITLADICERLHDLGRDVDSGQELFLLLDSSQDNIVTRAEFDDVVMRTAQQLKRRATALSGITTLLLKLEVLLCILVAGLILFIYTLFFDESLANNLANLGAGIVALSFAFAGPVADLVNSCVWVFAKHSYDVGDLIEVLDRRLEVRQIFLTHTNFVEFDSGKNDSTRKVVQISHASMGDQVLVNWTRSHDAVLDQSSVVVGKGKVV